MPSIITSTIKGAYPVTLRPDTRTPFAIVDLGGIGLTVDDPDDAYRLAAAILEAADLVKGAIASNASLAAEPTYGPCGSEHVEDDRC